MEPEQTTSPDKTELGATGADLPLWRAREANGSLRPCGARPFAKGASKLPLKPQRNSCGIGFGGMFVGTWLAGTRVMRTSERLRSCVSYL
jgi:hypothetical protein